MYLRGSGPAVHLLSTTTARFTPFAPIPHVFPSRFSYSRRHECGVESVLFAIGMKGLTYFLA